MNVDVNAILNELSKIIGEDRAEVRCEVYKGATQLYLRFEGIASILSSPELNQLLALEKKAKATLYVMEIPKTSQEKQGVKVSLGIGPVLVSRTPANPLGTPPDPV